MSSEDQRASAGVAVGKGLTWRSLLALIFATLVVQPAMIYYYLVTGAGLALSTWIVILVWAEIARAFGRPLARQEVFIILAFESMLLAATLDLRWLFVYPVKNYYFATSPIAEGFGLTQLIPNWWVPSPALRVVIYGSRSFFHPDWLVPLAVMMLSVVFGLLANIALGYFTYQMYVSVEKLSFPAQAAAASAVVTIAEREVSTTRALLFSAIGGVGYNFFTVFIPFMLGGTFILMPRGTLDFTAALENLLPGAALGFSTEMFPYLTGFLVPVGVSAFQLVGAFSFYFIGNHLLTTWKYWPAEFLWRPGLGMGVLIFRSQLYFWVSVIIGLSLAATFVPMIMHPRRLASAFGGLARAGGREGGTSLWLLLAMFLGASFASVALVAYLVPGFPLWILILFTVGWSFFATFVSALASGVTFGTFNIPYMRETAIYYSGYRAFDIWLAPMNVYTGGASICGALLQADMVGCRHSEYVKAYVIIAALSTLMSFVFVSMLWNLAPIPSGVFPYTVTNWPVEAMDWWRWQKWLWGGLLFHRDAILGSLGVGAAVVVASDLLHVPYALISFVMGTIIAAPTPVGPLAWSLAMFVGTLFGKYLIEPFIGKENWNKIKGQVVVGFSIGDGLMYTLQAAITLAGRSMWLLPY